MAGHKTKYKKPKDLEASQTKAFIKKYVRKALKDYVKDDKDGRMNPNSANEIQKNVLRKRDKQVIDNVENMVPNKKDVADYYKVNGEHDPKHTAKERSKLQDEDEKMSKEEIKDKIENLTREGKERLVREYVRRKIKKVLAEKKNAKPDYLDFDDDGDEEESMKKALKDKEEKEQLNDLKEQDAAAPPTIDEPETDEPETDEPETDEPDTDEPETDEDEPDTDEDDASDDSDEAVFGNPAENKYFEWLQKQPSAKKKIESTFNILHKTLENIQNKPEKKAVRINFNKGIKQLRKMLNINPDQLSIDD